MKNVVKILVVIGLCTQLSACDTYTSEFDSNKGYFDNNGVSSDPKVISVINRSMDSFDQERLGHALSTTRNIQPFAWQNPVSGNNYKVMPQRTYVDDQGEPCRYYLFAAIIHGLTYTMRATACRVDGTWQMNS